MSSPLRALVYKRDRLAATLLDDRGTVQFAYDEQYLREGGPSVASTLPLGGQPITLLAGATPAYFAGLLPEGRRLSAIRQRLKTSVDRELALLLEIGRDPIGDVRILAPAGATHSTTPSDEDPETLDLPAGPVLDVRFAQLRDEHFGRRSTGLPGVQDKVSSKMLTARARSQWHAYIVKFNPDDVPFAVENEAVFLGLAKECGIDTAPYELLTDSAGEHALRLMRFDRLATTGAPRRLAAEDGTQALGLYPAAKYDVDFIELAGRLSELCSAPRVAGYRLLQQLVLNWLIGNGDAHAKNFSILEGPGVNPASEQRVELATLAEPQFVIAPAYDLLCTAFYDDRDMALPLDGKRSGWDRDLLVSAGAALGVNAKSATTVIDKQLKVLADLPDRVLRSPIPVRRDQKNAAARLIGQRAKALR